MASVVTDMTPLWRWSLALIAGGGAAATSQLLTTKLRAVSSVGTGGLGNPVLSTVELGISTLLSILAVLWPIVAVGSGHICTGVLVAGHSFFRQTCQTAFSAEKRRWHKDSGVTAAL